MPQSATLSSNFEIDTTSIVIWKEAPPSTRKECLSAPTRKHPTRFVSVENQNHRWRWRICTPSLLSISCKETRKSKERRESRLLLQWKLSVRFHGVCVRMCFEDIISTLFVTSMERGDTWERGSHVGNLRGRNWKYSKWFVAESWCLSLREIHGGRASVASKGSNVKGETW